MEAQSRWYFETLPLNDQVVVDVGANVGVLSEFFVRAGARRVLSVEPLAENVAEVRRRIAGARAEGVWSVRECAASSRTGEVALRLGGDEETPHNSVVTARAEGAQRVVPCDTLANLCPDATVVKLDIEGHEYEVLDEALGALPAVRAWAIELHMVPGRSLSTTLQALAAQGFSLIGAGRLRSDPSGRWASAPVPPTLEWDAIPVAQRRPDGSVFKMLHVVARR